jgi:hypothetical protein
MKKELKEKKRIRLKNKKLLKKYPWLTPIDWWGGRVRPKVHKYEWTLLDEIPRGWVKAFGEMMCEELDQVLIKNHIKSDFYILQLKEKWGRMEMYHNHCIDEVDQVIDKYSYLSENICAHCGLPDVPMTTDGWCIPLCKKCFDNDERWDKLYVNKEEYMADFYTIRRWNGDEKIETTYDISETAEKIRSHYHVLHRRSDKRLQKVE